MLLSADWKNMLEEYIKCTAFDIAFSVKRELCHLSCMQVCREMKLQISETPVHTHSANKTKHFAST